MRSTKLEVQQRVEAIFQLRLGGAEFHDIREYAGATTDEDGKPREPWGVSDTQLRRYIAMADELYVKRFDAQAKHLRARHLLQRRRLYAHAMEMSDIRTALAILKDEAELERLYEARDPAGPPGEGALAAPMGTADVVGVLSERLRQTERADLPAAEKTRLTAALADALLRAIGVDVLDKRLEALQAVLGGRKDR
jgi:hypothetical protein